MQEDNYKLTSSQTINPVATDYSTSKDVRSTPNTMEMKYSGTSGSYIPYTTPYSFQPQSQTYMSAAYPYGATGGLESPGTYKIAEPSGTTGTDPYGNLGLSGSYNTTKVITYGPSSATEALKTSGTYVTSGVTTKPEDYGAKSGSYETYRSPSYSANTGLKTSNSYEINYYGLNKDTSGRDNYQSHMSTHLNPESNPKAYESVQSNYTTNYASTAYASNQSTENPEGKYESTGYQAAGNYLSVGGYQGSGGLVTDDNYGKSSYNIHINSGNSREIGDFENVLKNYPEKKISDTNSKEPIEAERLYKSVQNPKTPIRSDNERMPRQYMSIPGTKFERETVLSPYRHTLYKEFDEIVEDLPDRTNLLNIINATLKKSPNNERLLASPTKVSINRTSDLEPARIYVETPLFEKYEDGSIYQGESRKGKRNGKGKIYYPDGKKLEGEFRDGKIEGFGHLYSKTGSLVFEGNYDNDKFHGHGKLYNEYPAPAREPFNHKDFNTLKGEWYRYEGDFRNGKKNGVGTLFLVNGEKYYGEFKDDKIHGKGNFYLKDQNDGIAGEWRNNKLVEKF